MATVAIEKLPDMDYVEACVSLPRSYGTPEWERIPQVQAIRSAVHAVLDTVAARTKLVERLRGRRVIVKPNLVVVYHKVGTRQAAYPETTDPRVLDALVLWLANVAGAADIIIAESSGRGSPTRASFAISGVDRLARHRGCGLLALEEQAVSRYFLPKAKVQREILVPSIFDEVIRGEAAYISVPKLKTNLYTGVTLGFKNAMGIIPYNLRQRAHHHAINRKLVEMLYLFKPDLVLIDGVVGGEGECPAPVDPVRSGVLIAGDHAVETDRVATRLMGFDPASIPLMRLADELGFAATEPVAVLGPQAAIPFRPADASLLSERVRSLFPCLTVLYGLARGLPELADPASLDRNSARTLVRTMEDSCRGGCVASTRFGLAMLEAEGLTFRKPVLLVIGPGLPGPRGKRWLDAEGHPWDEAAIAAFPGKSAVIGSCGAGLAASCDWFVEGCMPLANAPHAILHRLSGSRCRLLSLRNRQLPVLVKGILEQRRARIRRLRSGYRLDVLFPYEDTDDRIPEYLERQAASLPDGKSWLAWPMEALESPTEKRLLIAAEDGMTLSSLTGILAPGLTREWGWRLKGLVTGFITWFPLILAVGIGTKMAKAVIEPIWLAGFSLILFVLHCVELPMALRTLKQLELTGRFSRRHRIGLLAGTLLVGFPAWLPYQRGELAIGRGQRTRKTIKRQA